MQSKRPIQKTGLPIIIIIVIIIILLMRRKKFHCQLDRDLIRNGILDDIFQIPDVLGIILTDNHPHGESQIRPVGLGHPRRRRRFAGSAIIVVFVVIVNIADEDGSPRGLYKLKYMSVGSSRNDVLATDKVIAIADAQVFPYDGLHGLVLTRGVRESGIGLFNLDGPCPLVDFFFFFFFFFWGLGPDR